MKTVIVSILFCFTCFAAMAQELEPRAYANLPKGLNVAAFAYGLSHGNVISDPSLPITDFKITVHNFGAAYVHSFAIADKLARIQVVVPFVHMSGRLKMSGADTSGTRTGFGDARIRLGINLTGSPALDKKAFSTYQQKTIIGVSILASVPTGVYYKDKKINIGSNRWAFKPEIGISHRFKHVYAELYTGLWIYTNNNEYLVNQTLNQEAVFSLQAHACYYFKNRMWIGINGNWFNGGETVIDDVPAGDLKDNWRVGATWSVPLTPKQSLKFQFHIGAFTNTGYDYDVASVGYQLTFF